jgi:hypothetical protein
VVDGRPGFVPARRDYAVARGNVDGGVRAAYDEWRYFPVVNNRLWEMKRGEKIADFGLRIAD